MSTGDTKTGQKHEHGKMPQVVGGDNCRCEETSKMTPRQLLGLMLKDLVFWKKSDTGKQRKS